MVMEVSGNYSIVLPVILANTIAYLISRSLQPVPILEIFTHQDGLDLPSMEEQREESNLHLEDALHPVAVPVLQGLETLAATGEVLAQYPESLRSAGRAGALQRRALVCGDGGGAGAHPAWHAGARGAEFC